MWWLGAVLGCTSGNGDDTDVTTLPVVTSPTATVPCDVDADGHAVLACGGSDCDDGDPLIHAGAVEVCNTVDDDCDTWIDDLDPNLDVLTGTPWWPDADGDGAGIGEPSHACVAPAGSALVAGDCDALDSTVGPFATEVCNVRDDDCDGLVDHADPDIVDAVTYFADLDADGFGDPATSTQSCAPFVGGVLDDTDCAPLDPLWHVVVTWWADADDDGFGDPASYVMACEQPGNAVTNPDDCDPADSRVHEVVPWWPDTDGDGHGDPTAVPVDSCAPVPDHTVLDDDCDDTDPEEFPGALWYEDDDGDGDGDPTSEVESCLRPDGLVSVGHDCDDADPDLHSQVMWYADADGDGFGDPNVPRSACAPNATADDASDCDDTHGSDFPGALERCDGRDNDCNLTVDDGLLPAYGFQDAQLIRDQGRFRGFAAVRLVPFDPDVDGDLDMLWVDSISTGWGENLGEGVFASAPNENHAIPRTYTDWTDLPDVGDYDDDGDPDLLVTSPDEDALYWYENTGAGVYVLGPVVSAVIDHPWAPHVMDVDGDGDGDALVTSSGAGTVSWFENLGGGLFGAEIVLATPTLQPTGLLPRDVDADGDEDIVVYSISSDSTVEWLENLGSALFAAPVLLLDTGDHDDFVSMSDLDADGDDDLVLLVARDGLLWYEQVAGVYTDVASVAGDFDTVAPKGSFFDAAVDDLDSDGDLDLLAGAFDGWLAWFVQRSPGVFGPGRDVRANLEILALATADLDADGHRDIVGGLFDTGDIVWFAGVSCE